MARRGEHDATRINDYSSAQDAVKNTDLSTRTVTVSKVGLTHLML